MAPFDKSENKNKVIMTYLAANASCDVFWCQNEQSFDIFDAVAGADDW